MPPAARRADSCAYQPAGPLQRRHRPPPYAWTMAGSRSLSSTSSSSSVSSSATTLLSASSSATSSTSLGSSSSSVCSSASRRRASPSTQSSGINKRRGSPTGALGQSKAKPTSLVLKATPREVVASAAKAALSDKEAAEYRTLQQQVYGLCESQYVDEVASYMLEMENQTRPVVETIDMQPELQWYMRPYLLDFLIEIHQQYRLRPETLYLAVNIIDRYVSKRIVYKKHYQLVGCSALWIAAKFEDAKDRVPTVQELCAMCCGAYEESAFLQMEQHVLQTIGWVLGHPTAEAWLRLRCCGGTKAWGMEEQRTQHVARFLMEITLFHRAFVGAKASDIAAACLLLARYMLQKSRRPFEETSAMLQIVHILDTNLAEQADSVSAIVLKKYSFSFYSRSANIVRDWYRGGRRFSALSWPTHSLMSRSTSVSTNSTLSSPTSSTMASSPRSATSTAASSDGLCCDLDESCLCAGTRSVKITSVDDDDAADDCDMVSVAATEVDDDSEEPPRYAVVDVFAGSVSVKENLRERDLVALAAVTKTQNSQSTKQANKEALGVCSTWSANVVPMSC